MLYHNHMDCLAFIYEFLVIQEAISKSSQYLRRKVCDFTFPLNPFGHNDGHHEFCNCLQQAPMTIGSGKMLENLDVLLHILVALCQ